MKQESRGQLAGDGQRLPPICPGVQRPRERLASPAFLPSPLLHPLQKTERLTASTEQVVASSVRSESTSPDMAQPCRLRAEPAEPRLVTEPGAEPRLVMVAPRTASILDARACRATGAGVAGYRRAESDLPLALRAGGRLCRPGALTQQLRRPIPHHSSTQGPRAACSGRFQAVQACTKRGSWRYGQAGP